MKTKGKHIVIDMFDCNCKSNLLDDKPLLTTKCINAVEITQNKIVKIIDHQFEPQGISIIVMLAESHLSLHTYPEEKYVSIDIYSCGLKATPEKALPFFLSLFEPQSAKYIELTRGVKKKTKIKEELHDLTELGYIKRTAKKKTTSK